MARAWRFPLLRLDLAAAFGDRARSPEVTMREATAVAESLAPAVLWIDEIEKAFASAARPLSTTGVTTKPASVLRSVHAWPPQIFSRSLQKPG